MTRILSDHLNTIETMNEQQVHVSVEQRIIIKFLAEQGVKPTEILLRLQAQFDNNTLSRTRVFEWHKEFSEGCVNPENQSYNRSARTSTTEANIEAVRQVMENDRRITP